MDSVPQYFRASGLVQEIPIPEFTGNTREFSEIEANEYLKYKGEGDAAERAQIQQGYSSTMTKYRVGENLGITYEMRHENKYPQVIRALTSGGKKGPNTIDLDLTHRFTFGTATSYTDMNGRTIAIDTGDDLQLFYSAHLLKGSTTTYRNRLANNPKLSKGAIEAMERLITEETYNNLGEKMVCKFDILWCGDDPNTVNGAKEYLGSVADPEAAHAGVTNVYKGKYRLVVLPRLATTAVGAPDSTKRYYWGIASSEKTTMYLGMWEEPHLIPPTEGNSNGEDVETDDQDFRIRAGYGIVTCSGVWVKMSSGNSEA